MTWPTVALSEVCEINVGRTPSRSEPAYWGPSTPWLSIADMNQGRDLVGTKETITDLAVKGATAKLVVPGTVLLSFKLSIGKVGIARLPMFTNEAIAALPIRDPSILLSDYLCWALASMDLTGGANRAAMGATLNKAKLRQVMIPLPSMDEQRRIAAILDQADGLRAKRRAALVHLDHLAESMFVDLFGHEGDDAQSWPREPLKDLAEVITKGTTPTSVGFQFTESGVPFVRVQNLVGATVDFAPGALFIDSKTHVALKRSRILPGDILVSIAGTIGRTSIVPLDAKEMNCNQAVAIVRLKAGVNRHFVRAWLSSADAHRQVSASAVTATISNLSLSQLGLLQIIQPPASLQDEFSDRLGSVTALKDLCAKSQLRIESLFASVQSRAFAGEL